MCVCRSFFSVLFIMSATIMGIFCLSLLDDSKKEDHDVLLELADYRRAKANPSFSKRWYRSFLQNDSFSPKYGIVSTDSALDKTTVPLLYQQTYIAGAVSFSTASRSDIRFYINATAFVPLFGFRLENAMSPTISASGLSSPILSLDQEIQYEFFMMSSCIYSGNPLLTKTMSVCAHSSSIVYLTNCILSKMLNR